MLPLPPPPFPTRFDHSNGSSKPTAAPLAIQSWPEAGEMVQEQSDARVKWELQTEREQYLDALGEPPAHLMVQL